MLILASQSPRRRELLANAGIPFTVCPASLDETVNDGELPEDYVKRLAEQKALAIAGAPGDIVLGADTVVVIANQILGKPAGVADAIRMLHALSGRKHEVITGICLKGGGKLIADWAVTKVWFAQMSDTEIEQYVASGEPMDKAGAYAIQGMGSKFIERIDGSYNNVVGLPVSLVYKYLKTLSA
ncbi:MAG: Maf family protein [Acidobacteriota bacterium]|nr:Maf family protein [Acidobacteriota bacterium]